MYWTALVVALCSVLGMSGQVRDRPFLDTELVFPLEHWHNHASMVVELPGGNLLVCWFHGSGERTADDVVIRGARLRKGSRTWSEPFLLADTPGYPDTNATVFLDPKKRLWLMWPTILANEWHTALMKYKIASDYRGDGPPRWDVTDVMHVTPGDEFAATVNREVDRLLASQPADDRNDRLRTYADQIKTKAADKLSRRLGWMTRAHPYVLDGSRLIVPLYSDGFSFSLMAISDDWGATWKTSTPIVGRGNIQPSLARKKDGTLVAYMRDNGPAPKRLMVSRSADRGETWSAVEDSDLPNPGSGAEVLVLANGNWVLIYNDLERGRSRLAVSLSEDEGRTWRWTRYLERDPDSADEQHTGQYHYPSIIQAADGTLHATYSIFAPVASVTPDRENRLPRKAIKHAHFNELWIRSGDGSGTSLRPSLHPAPYPPRLPQVPALVRRDDVQAGGEAEPQTADERIGKAHAGEIDVGVAPQEPAHIVVRGQERRHGIGQRWRVARRDQARRLAPGERLRRWLERADEPSPDDAGQRRAAAATALRQGAGSGRRHRLEIDAIGGRQVIETLGDAPRSRRRPPAALRFGQARDEGPRIPLVGRERLVQRHELRRDECGHGHHHLHAPYL